MKTTRAMAVTVAVGMAAIFTGAEAQIVIPIGTLTSCGVSSVATLNGGAFPNATVTATGTITFKAVGQSAPGQPSSTTQIPTAFNATANDPVLGKVTWRLDPTRAAVPTTVTANQTGVNFPATGTINIPVEATIASQPGRVYRSIGQVQLSNRNLQSFNPHVNEVYTQTGVSSFEDVAAPGVVAFTIPTMQVTVNGTGTVTPNQQGGGGNGQ